MKLSLINPGIIRDGGAELQLLVSVPNIPGLNNKSLRSAFSVKAYVLLTAIRSSDGDVQPGGPLGAFRNSRFLLPTSGPRIHPSYITS